MDQPTLFIVEDEAIVANDLKETLISLGYAVTGIAKSGEIALEMIAGMQPDLVLMDIHLAGTMDGIDTAGKVRELYRIPVVYLTAYADTALLERAKKTEPYGYIVKPYDDRGLQSAVEVALSKSRADERVRESEELIRSLVNLNHQPVFILDRNTRVIVANDALAARQAVPGNPPATRTLDTLAASGLISDKLLAAVREHFNDRAPFKFEEEFHDTWLTHIITPLADQDGQVTRCAVESFEVTDIKNRELGLTELTQELEREKQSLALFAAMLDSMDDLVIATDMMGKILYVNKTFQDRFGYSKDEILGTHISTLKNPDDLFAMDSNRFFVDKKSVWSGTVTLKNKFGITIRTLLKSTPVSLGERQSACRVFVFREPLCGA